MKIMEEIGVKQGKVKIWHLLVCMVFLLLCYIGISNSKVTDDTNAFTVERNIVLKNDSLEELRLCYEEEYQLQWLKIEVPAVEEDVKIYFNLTDEKGYYLKTGNRIPEQGQDGAAIAVSFKTGLDKGTEYTLQLGLEETDLPELEAAVKLDFVGYKKLNGSIQAGVMLLGFFLTLGFFIVISENSIYMQWKNRVWKILTNLRAPTLAEYFIFAVFFLILFMSNSDGDTLAFVHYEVNFWRSVFEEGGLQHFYDFSYKMEQYYKANQIGGAFAAYYDFPMFILFGIWGLPLYIICNGLGIEETSNMWTIVYGKSIFIVALVVAAYMIYKICRNMRISKEQAKWAVFLFMTSVLVLVEVAYIGQLDILGIIFTLLGIYYYQKNDRRKFIVFFMIAVTFKQFPLFIFIPLLLLVEKNVLKIGIDTIIVLGFSKLTGLPFRGDRMAIEVKNGFSETSLECLLGVKAPLYNDTVPVIILLLGAICAFCYIKKIENQKELEEYSVFIALLSMFILLISFDSNPYWYIQLAPFVAILLVYNSKQYMNLILFETVGMLCLILNQFGANYWCFEPSNGEGMLMTKIFGKADHGLSMFSFAGYVRLDKFSGVLFAGFIVCMAAFLWINRPGKMEIDESMSIRPYALLRMLANIGVAYVPILLYVVSALFL